MENSVNRFFRGRHSAVTCVSQVQDQLLDQVSGVAVINTRMISCDLRFWEEVEPLKL